jgi:hypothetical protein
MTPALQKIWCDEDEHYRYEHFADFNEWLDIRAEYGVDVLPQTSEALFSGERANHSGMACFGLSPKSFTYGGCVKYLIDVWLRPPLGEQPTR